MLLEPIIKFNGGRPVALCNNCSRIMCYVSCTEEILEKNGNCIVVEICGTLDGDYISTPIGKVPPVYCNKCDEENRNNI
jgi:hypothetical protein